MALVIQNSAGVQNEVDSGFGSQRVSLRPLTVTGQYSFSVPTGAMTTIAAGTATTGHIFAFRWGAASNCLIRRITLEALITTGFTAAQRLAFNLITLTGYTLNHSGGTPLAFAGSAKHRTTFGTSLVSDARVATAAALTSGIHTSDPNALAQVSMFAAAATAGGRLKEDLFNEKESGYPLTLSTNEGFIIRNEVLMGAGGVVQAIVSVEWQEVATYTAAAL
jgi:hypothetical protein